MSEPSASERIRLECLRLAIDAWTWSNSTNASAIIAEALRFEAFVADKPAGIVGGAYSDAKPGIAKQSETR